MKKDLTLPFDLRTAQRLTEKFGTPVYVYDEEGIRAQSKKLYKAFDWAKGYRNFFAVKATPTPAILRVLQEEGMGFDCSSRAELLMMDRMRIPGRDIFYTSNNTPKEDFELAIKLGATVNIDDFAQIPVFMEALGSKHLGSVAARYNPGGKHTGNSIIGHPKDAKFGMGVESLIESFSYLKKCNIQRFGLHAMVASNELNPRYFEDTVKLILSEVKEIEERTGIEFSFINLGGGFGLNYKTDQAEFDIATAAELIRIAVLSAGREDLEVYTENGRYVTGPHGYLLTKARYIMRKDKTYIGVDASMHNLMRPGMYGASHHITVLGREDEPVTRSYDVVGSLCENNDKFAIDRELPWVQPGDIMVIHDAGAHAHAMGFNYNGMLRSAEVLLNNGEGRRIRKAETVDDYFRNLIWE